MCLQSKLVVQFFPGVKISNKPRRRRPANEKDGLSATFSEKKGISQQQFLNIVGLLILLWTPTLCNAICSIESSNSIHDLDSGMYWCITTTQQPYSHANTRIPWTSQHSSFVQPDLASCHLFLFPTLKSKIRVRNFNSTKAAVNVYKETQMNFT